MRHFGKPDVKKLYLTNFSDMLQHRMKTGL